MMIVMPRFHFDIHDGEEFIDDDGIELSDLSDAETHAVAVLKALVRWSGSDWGDEHAVVVKNDAGDGLLRASVKVEIRKLMS